MATSSARAGMYRDREEMAKLRLAEIFGDLSQRARRAEASSRALVYRRRLARAVAGVVGAIGGVVVLVLSGLSLRGKDALQAWNVTVLCATLVATAAAYLLARLDAGARLRRGLRSLIGLTHDADRDLARLERVEPSAFVGGEAQRFLSLSIAAPMAAIALLGPLTLHFIVGGLPVLLADEGLAPFGQWMAFSAVVVGHAHLVLAFVSWRFTRRLVRGQSGPVVREGFKALGWTVLAAAIPGALLLMLPPLITAVTGLAVVLPTFWWASRTAGREHAELSGLSVL